MPLVVNRGSAKDVNSADFSAACSARQDALLESRILKLLAFDLVAAVVTQKIGIPIGSGSQIELPLIAHLLTLGLLGKVGALKLHKSRLLLYLLLIMTIFVGHVFFGAYDYSLPSILLFVLIYSCFNFVVETTADLYFRVLRMYQRVAMLVAGLVLFNWLTQIVGLGLVNLERMIPDAMVFRTYVYIQPLNWGSHWMKPNALFFLETSHTSQFLALALIFEACFFQRATVLALLALAQVLTFGGTGFLVLAAAAPFVLAYLRPKLIILALIAFPLIGVVAYQIGVVDNIAKRSTEYQVKGSSADNRFVVPLEVMNDALNGDTKELQWGIGAGNMPRALNVVWSPASKIMKEYGVWALGIFFVFYFYCMFGGGVPFVAAYALSFEFQLLNGSTLVPIHSIYCYLLAGAFVFTGPATRPAPRPGKQRVLLPRRSLASATASGGGLLPQ